jgi:hypothetical protein
MTTEIIVTEVNNAVVIERKEPVVVSSQSQTKIVVGGMIGPHVTTLRGLSDLDLTDLTGGSLLVYNAGTEKWTATTMLNQQVVDAGQF